MAALPFCGKSACVGVTSIPSGAGPFRVTDMGPRAALENVTSADSPAFSDRDSLSALTLWRAMFGEVRSAEAGSVGCGPAGTAAPMAAMRGPIMPNGVDRWAVGSTCQYHLPCCSFHWLPIWYLTGWPTKPSNMMLRAHSVSTAANLNLSE